MAHRMMAVVAFAALVALAVRLLRTPGLRGWAVLLGLLACTQVALGIANVKLSLPLDVAVAHSAGAVLLLFVLVRSEEHTSELQSLMRISYAVFCLKKKKKS